MSDNKVEPKPFPNCERCEHLVLGICSIPIKGGEITCPKDKWREVFVAWLKETIQITENNIVKRSGFKNLDDDETIADFLEVTTVRENIFHVGYLKGVLDTKRKVLERMGEK